MLYWGWPKRQRNAGWNGRKGEIPVEEWYFEYHIHKNRPGLLGDIASLLGMLSINIVTINGVDENRGMLLHTADRHTIIMVRAMLRKVPGITVTALRPPTLLDRLALRHGRFIHRDMTADQKTYRFTRNDLGLLVDFLGELLKRPGHQVIGVRGMPRVGKTESIVAASVYANKRWTFVSSTLLKQTVRYQLSDDELSADNMVYIIDGIVSTLRAGEQHQRFVREILRLPAPIVIEHPDIFIRETEFGMDMFDRIVELRNTPDEAITYENLERTL
jgi:hypothetical protein